MKKENEHFGSAIEAIVYPLLLALMMWVIYWAERTPGIDLVRFGVRPHDWASWKGVIFMPLLHAPTDFSHIINNTFPIVLLFAALIYYYREIAFNVFFISWIFTGLGVWVLATGNSYHIGMSGVIYALFGFLFISGFLRSYRPLQAISLFVVLMYGSMVWGIFPQKAAVSWEGHLSGLFIGVMLAIFYRNKGPKGPKYQYEIEKELGIEPPDLEGLYHARLEAMEAQRLAMEEQLKQQGNGVQIVYHILPNQQTKKEVKTPPDDNATE